MERIVVWDPRGRIPEGSVVRVSAQQALDELAGVASLPVEQRLLELGPIAGYYRRSWGKGERFERMAARRACPMAIHAVPGYPYLHWAARVVPAGGAPGGSLRLVPAPSALATMTGGLSAVAEPVTLSELGEPDAWGGWTVSRAVELACSSEGLMCVALQGAAERCVVLWSAVSLSARRA